jgi:serine/threonine protein phosphatase PrpC
MHQRVQLRRHEPVVDENVFLDGELVRRTRDHSLVQVLVDSGTIDEAAAMTHPNRNLLTRAMGAEMSVPDVYRAGRDWDAVLLCSDGLHGVFTEAKLADWVYRRPVQDIVREALQRESSDNITVLRVLSR